MKINLFESFAGIGAQRRALEQLYPGDVNSIGICEWNVLAVIAYFSIHEGVRYKNRIVSGGGANL